MNGPTRVWVVLNAQGRAFAMATSEPPGHVFKNGETAIPYVPAAATTETDLAETIENRALDLLCGECDLDREDYDEGERMNAREALRAVVAALTPPEGYVLVPAEPTEEMIAAAEEAHMPFGDMGIAISTAIGARPEVP